MICFPRQTTIMMQISGSDIHYTGQSPTLRRFQSGAVRDQDANKLDYEGFLHPLVLQRYAEYMHKHRSLPDGSLRDSDNWQKGIPRDAYMKSGWRHFMDWWSLHRGLPARESIEEALCALIFNAMGYLSVLLVQKCDQNKPL